MKPPLRLRGKLPYARPDPHGWMHDAIIELVEDTPITVTAGTVLTLAVRDDLRTHPRSAEVTIEFIECHHTRAPNGPSGSRRPRPTTAHLRSQRRRESPRGPHPRVPVVRQTVAVLAARPVQGRSRTAPDVSHGRRRARQPSSGAIK